MPRTILILDDDRHVRESLAMNLEDEEFTVLQAGSAEEALDVLEETRADLAIVDLRLPGMNGPDFIKAAMKRWDDMRFIVYTGSPEFRIATDLSSLPNVSGTIFLKPLSDSETIVAEIRRMLA